MTPRYSKTAFSLSVIIAALALVASAGGLVLKNLYHDNPFVTTTWRGNDLVTLFLALPILVIALIFTARGSLHPSPKNGGGYKAQLVWFGAIDYMLYNYAFYLFGSAFNAFFLIYAALLGLSIFTLIFGLASLDAALVSQQFSSRTPVRWIGGDFLFVAIGLSLVYLMQSIGYILTGQMPAIVTTSEHPTNIVFALDFTLLIPWLALSGVWLIKRQPWGYVIAGIISVKAPLYTLALSINTLLLVQAGLASSSDLPLWGTLTVLGLAASALLYGNMNPPAKEPIAATDTKA
jgi:hypothetical protein